MKRVVVSAVLFLLVLSLPVFAAVSVDVKVSLPHIELRVPPVLVVVPGTYVYAAPDVPADLVFYQGFWWRPYGGAWYRSNEYNGAWVAMPAQAVPVPVRNLPPNWKQVPPGYERMPYGQVKQNWPVWERERHWDKAEHRGGGRAAGVGVAGQPMPAQGGRAVGAAAEGRPAPAPVSGGQYQDRPSGGSHERTGEEHDKKHKKDKKNKKEKKEKKNNHEHGEDGGRHDGREEDRHGDRGGDHGHNR